MRFFIFIILVIYSGRGVFAEGVQAVADQEKLFNEIMTSLKKEKADWGALNEGEAANLISAYIENRDQYKKWISMDEIKAIVHGKEVKKLSFLKINEINSLILERNKDELRFGVKMIDYLDTDRPVELAGSQSNGARFLSKNEMEGEWLAFLMERYRLLLALGETRDEAKKNIKMQYAQRLERLESSNPDQLFEEMINPLLELVGKKTEYVTRNNFGSDQSKASNFQLFYEQKGDYPVVKRFGVYGNGPDNIVRGDKIVAVSSDGKSFRDLWGESSAKTLDQFFDNDQKVIHLKLMQGNHFPLKTVSINFIGTAGKDELGQEWLEVPTVDKKYNIAVLKIPSFYIDFKAASNGDKDYKSVSRDLSRVLVKIKSKNVDGIIIDLRNNGGGSYIEGASILDSFVPNGLTHVLLESSGNVLPQKVKAMLDYQGPIVVLVNRNSGGIAEMVAAGLADNALALVVGQKTSGDADCLVLKKRLSYGFVDYCTAKIYRINGISISNGIVPHIQLYAAQEVQSKSSDNHLNVKEDSVRSFSFSLSDLQKKYQHNMVESLASNAGEKLELDISVKILMDIIISNKHLSD